MYMRYKILKKVPNDIHISELVMLYYVVNMQKLANLSPKQPADVANSYSNLLTVDNIYTQQISSLTNRRTD